MGEGCWRRRRRRRRWRWRGLGSCGGLAFCCSAASSSKQRVTGRIRSELARKHTASRARPSGPWTVTTIREPGTSLAWIAGWISGTVTGRPSMATMVSKRASPASEAGPPGSTCAPGVSDRPVDHGGCGGGRARGSHRNDLGVLQHQSDCRFGRGGRFSVALYAVLSFSRCCDAFVLTVKRPRLGSML